MRMQKRQFRIGDLAKQLNVEKFVIRFWEKEFKVSTSRSQGGQRFYNEDDLHTFQNIKTLLYDQGFTIAGAKKLLNTPTTVIASQKTTLPAAETPSQELTIIKEKLRDLKEKLKALSQAL